LVNLIEDDDAGALMAFESCIELSIDVVSWESGDGDVGAEVACEFGDEPVFGVCHFFQFAVDVDYAEGDVLCVSDGLEFVRGGRDAEGFAGAGFAVDEKVAWFFTFERRREDACDVFHLRFTVVDGFGRVIGL